MDKETAEALKGTSEALDALTEEIRQQGHHLIEYIRSMQESIEDLRTEIQHAIRNLLPEFQLRSMAKDPCDPQWAQKLNKHSEQIVESVHCFECDAQMDSLAKALQNGWTELCRDDGVSWNYLGLCPACVNQEIERIAQMQTKTAEAPKAPGQSTLFWIRRHCLIGDKTGKSRGNGSDIDCENTSGRFLLGSGFPCRTVLNARITARNSRDTAHKA